MPERLEREPGRMRRLGDERGIALILALLVLALLMALVLEFDAEARRELKEAAIFRDSLRAMALSRAATQAVRAILKEDTRLKRAMGVSRDALMDLWATPLNNFPIGDGTLSGRLEDERGKLNLNDLASQTDAEARKKKISSFKRLFEIVQVDPLLVETLADWVDADDTPEPYGAENLYYQSLTPPYRCANGHLESLAELHLIKGFTDDVMQRLIPYVTVYPIQTGVTQGWINLNTADSRVIQALDSRITAGMARAVAQARPFRTIQDPDGVAGFEPVAKALRLASAYRVSSDTFSATATITVNEVTKIVHVVLQRNGEQGDSSVVYFRTE